MTQRRQTEVFNADIRDSTPDITIVHPLSWLSQAGASFFDLVCADESSMLLVLASHSLKIVQTRRTSIEYRIVSTKGQ